MRTRIIDTSLEMEEGIRMGAELLLDGELVAFPTETVYGLGADGTNGAAVGRIFEAKGRPQDNPLILHIWNFRQLEGIWSEIPETARLLADAFWPGPLTMIFRTGDGVPAEVTAGLDTVAVRMPSHPVAYALLERCGVPVAAPSANLSGKPSPTTAQHVLEDMRGRIPLILDGGSAGYGVESTVVSLAGEPKILRPGAVTREMLESVLGPVGVAESILRPLLDGETASSPGMKYRHYAPDAQVRVIMGEERDVAEETVRLYDDAVKNGKSVMILSTAQTATLYGERKQTCLGSRRTPVEMCSRLFSALRENGKVADLILAEGIGTQGEGLAYMNRLLRSAGFDVVYAGTEKAPVQAADPFNEGTHDN